MVSKRNQRLLLEKRSDKREFHYGLRKLTVGVASVLLGTTVFLGGQVVHADTVNSGEASVQVKQPVSSMTDSSASVSQVAVNENQSSAVSSVVVSSVQNAFQSVSRVAQPVNQGSAQASSQVDFGADNKASQSSNAVSSAVEMSLSNSLVDFGSSASAAQNFQVSTSDMVKPMMPQMMLMAVNDSHYQMNKVVSTGRDLWMAFDVPFVWSQPNQIGNGVLALGDGHRNGDLAPWKFQVYTQWHRNSDNGQWQFVSGYTSDPAHYALETSEVKILGSQSQNGHTFTTALLPITVNAYTLKDQLQPGGYYIMVPGLNAQAGLDQLSGSWTASIPVGANGQIPLGRLGVTVSKIQYVTGANHDQVISSVNVHQDIVRNGTAQAVNLSGIPRGYRLEYEQPSLTPVYSGYIPNDTAVNHSNCYLSINSDGTLTVNVPVTNSNIPADNNIKVNTAIDVVTDANYTPAVKYLPDGVTLGNPSDDTSENSYLDSFKYDPSTGMIHTSGWHASNKAKNAPYHYIELWDDTDKVVLAKKAVVNCMRQDVKNVHPNEFNALYSGWDTDFAITSSYMKTHTIKVISEYTTDPEGNNAVSSITFDGHNDWINADNINQLDINKVNYQANQQVHHLVYLTDQTKTYTTSDTMQKSDFVHSDSGLSQVDKSLLAQPMVIDWDHPTVQNSSMVYSDGRTNKTAAFGQNVDVTFDGDTVVYTAHLGKDRHYRVIEDLPNGNQKIVYEVNATFLRHSNGKYYADWLPTEGTYNSSHYSATISSSSSTGQVFVGSLDPGWAAMDIDDVPGYTWSVVPNAVLGNDYSKGLSFNRATSGLKIGDHTCTGNELVFDLLLGMNRYDTIAPSGDIHIKYTPKPTEQMMIVKYVDDDDNGRILQADTVKGLSGESSAYTTAKELGILRNQHYVLVSDETNGKPLVFDTDNNKGQVYTVHVKHDTEEEPISSMTVNGKIFYANTPGNLAKVPSDQMPLTQNISPINYDGNIGPGFGIRRDLVTHRWIIDQVVSSFPCGLLNQVDGFWLVPVVSSSPLIDQHFWGSSWQMAETSLFGLTGSGDSGSASVLGADIKVNLAEDTSSSMWSALAATVTVNFHFQYMPKAESAKITYVDDTTGNTLKTEEIAADYNTYVGMDTPGGPDILRAANGYGSKIQFKTDPATQIKLYQDQGYQLVSSNFTEGSTFKDVDNANVFTVHLAHAMTPVKPAKPINSGQTTSGGRPINGAHESDLNKTVIRTIILKMPGQTDQRIVQTVKLTRSASVDEVTGKVTYGNWSTDSWPDYHVPAKAHYTADKTMIASQMVDDTTVDQTVTVSYSLNRETAALTFIDDDTREVLATDMANGLYGSDILWNKDEADQISQFEKQGYVLVSNDFKRNPRPKFIDGLNAYTIHFTHGHQNVSHDYTVTRTINYVDANGTHLKPSTVQSLTFTRTGVQDLVTKDIVWNMTPAQSFSSVNDLYILGYKTDTTSVPAAEANWNDRNSTVDVHYQVVDSTVTVNFVDAMGHVVVSTPVTGQVGSMVDLAAQIPDGWVAYNTNIPTRVVIGVNSTYINYLIAHRLAFVKSTDGVKAGDIIPGTKSKIFNEKTNVDNLVIHASYTVNIWTDEAHTHKLATKTYHTDFIRNAAVDAITGDVYYYNWSEGGNHVFAGFTWQTSDGYQAVVVPSWMATQADSTKTIDLVAQPQQLSGTIQYQTVDGKVVSTQAFMGNTSVALSAPTGYTLMVDDITITPVPGRDQIYTVYVRPTQTLYTAADKLPVGMESLSKMIIRTIHITEANGHVRTIKQAVHFIRTATVKADGSIEYSNWQATGRAVMNKVFLPKRHGYHIVVDGDLAKQNVTADMSDLVVNIKYVKD